jgi:hypothetical protein
VAHERALRLICVLVTAVAGCAGTNSGDEDEIVVAGAIYTDFHVDAPCALNAAPAELSGVEVTFRDAEATALGQTATGAIEFQPLDFGEGKVGWTHPGCRYFAPYTATVARAESYTVSFKAPPARVLPGGGYFNGVESLESRTIQHADLEAAGFVWNFEAPPEFVVP